MDTVCPFKEKGQHIFLPQMTDMAHKDNLKLLYNTQLVNTCNDEEYKYRDISIFT